MNGKQGSQTHPSPQTDGGNVEIYQAISDNDKKKKNQKPTGMGSVEGVRRLPLV